MKIHIFQHAHFEDPGYIVDIALSGDNSITYTHFYKEFSLPKLKDIDLLVIMGGPMSIYDEDLFPWLKVEKAFIKRAIKQQKKILGICFGSQLIADALGAKVYANKQKEIGWYNVRKNSNTKSDFLDFFPNDILAFHWHGDTFDIPNNAKHLFSSQVTKNQGFIYNENVVALQFHWEIYKKNAEELVEYCIDDITNDTFIQTPKQLISNTHGFEVNKANIKIVLKYFGI